MLTECYWLVRQIILDVRSVKEQGWYVDVACQTPLLHTGICVACRLVNFKRAKGLAVLRFNKFWKNAKQVIGIFNIQLN